MPRRTTPSVKVSFRLSGPLAARLQERAAELELSPDLAAKELVVGALQESLRYELLESLRGLSTTVDALRRDITVSLEAVLLNVARLDERDVRTFVSDHLRR